MIRKKIAFILQPDVENDYFKDPIKVFENYNRILKYIESDHSFIKKLKDINVNLDTYFIGQISYQVQKYLELNYGRDAPKSNQLLFTKFPLHLFRDFNPQGALSIIVKEFLLFQINKATTSFDLLSGSPKLINHDTDDILPILKKIESLLLQKNFLKRPIVYFNKNIPSKDRNYYKKIITTHGGNITESPEHATMVVEWNETIDQYLLLSPELQSQEEEFIRPLEICWDTNKALVHWYYYPDSYDEYISRDEVDIDVNETFNNMAKTGTSILHGGIIPSNIQSQLQGRSQATTATSGMSRNPSGVGLNDIANTSASASNDTNTTTNVTPPPAVMNVCCRFVMDLEKFNEWCNEDDYTLEVVESQTTGLQGGLSTDNLAEVTGLTLTLKRQKSKRKSSAGGMSNLQKSQIAKEQESSSGYDTTASLFLDVDLPSKRMDNENVQVSDLTNDEIQVYKESESLTNNTPNPNPMDAVSNESTNVGDSGGVSENKMNIDSETTDTTATAATTTATTAKEEDKREDQLNSTTTNNNNTTATEETEDPAGKKQKTSHESDPTASTTTGAASASTTSAEQPVEETKEEDGTKAKHEDNEDEDEKDKEKPANTPVIPTINTEGLPAWFELTAVSDFEKQHLPWLQLQVNTPQEEDKLQQEYLYIRDRIILLSQQINPSTQQSPAANDVYLCVTQCRKVIGKDSNLILSIHIFLDTYGVINKNVPIGQKKVYYGYPLSATSVTNTDNATATTTTATATSEVATKNTVTVMGSALDEYLNLRLDALYKKVSYHTILIVLLIIIINM